ncbi:type VII secretion protein EssA [Heyndrickxia sporothermodurans]
MKGLMKHISILTIALIGGLSFYSLQTNAEEGLDDTGKIQFKIDRIGQEDTEREKLESQNYKETELEKIAPGLFKEQTRAVIETKQKEMNDELKQLEKNLFKTPIKVNTTNDLKRVLFSDKISIPNEEHVSLNKHIDEESGGISIEILITLIGFAMVMCLGIYILMRKLLA